MAEAAERQARVERLLEAARTLADHETAPGQALRARLLETTGLSPAGVERGLAHALEIRPSTGDLQALVASTPEAPRAHVLLSSNVFVAALRAIAIGVASSPRVSVRASRRDPALAESLHRLTPESFELVSSLSPAPGDHFWSYGADTTLAELRRSLPRGVWFHPHGAGFGAVVIDTANWGSDAARAVALDTALFDQQGCLSPRVVCVVGTEHQARIVAGQLGQELRALDSALPPGPKSAAEQAEARRDRDAAAYAFELFDAGSGWISCSSELVVPPGKRNLHVLATTNATATLAPFTAQLTCVATNGARFGEELRRSFPGARVVPLGQMQCPPLDGPVDRRHGARGELIS
jgi:hypothetical protein